MDFYCNNSDCKGMIIARDITPLTELMDNVPARSGVRKRSLLAKRSKKSIPCLG